MIERAHRTKRNYKDKRPRSMVLRLANFKDKSIILENANKLKGSDVYINEDFSRETTELRKKLWGEVKQFRSNHRRCSVRKVILRNFAKFTGNHLCQSLLRETASGSCVQRVNLLTLIIVQILLGIKGKNNLTKLLASIF